MFKLHDAEVIKHIQRETENRFAEVEEKIQSFFSEIDAEQIGHFNLFGFQQEVCDRIQHILTYQNHQKDKIGHQMIQELYAAISLEEFCFVSHSYVSENREVFKIVQ